MSAGNQHQSADLNWQFSWDMYASVVTCVNRLQLARTTLHFILWKISKTIVQP